MICQKDRWMTIIHMKYYNNNTCFAISFISSELKQSIVCDKYRDNTQAGNKCLLVKSNVI